MWDAVKYLNNDPSPFSLASKLNFPSDKVIKLTKLTKGK